MYERVINGSLGSRSSKEGCDVAIMMVSLSKHTSLCTLSFLLKLTATESYSILLF